jgi:bifunctional non-homologous end joining protein LigD
VAGRSRKWPKLECGGRQEVVVGGFTDPEGSRIGFGALLLGVFEGDELAHAGKGGTGLDDETLRRLRARLGGMERKTSPFSGEVHEKGEHWVSPELAAEVRSTEWTDDGNLRPARFVGLRRDKDPEEVVREG